MGLKDWWAKKQTQWDIEEQEKKAKEEEQERLRFDLEKLLDKYEMSDLKDFCFKYLGETPIDREKLKDGTERELKSNRHTFVNFILEYYDKGQLRAEQIKDFSLKHKIVTPSFFTVETESKSGNKSELNDILDTIEEKFKPEIILDEKELQGQLAVFLKAMYPDKKVDREHKTKSGDKLDMLIDDNYVLELKVPSSKESLRALLAQIDEYMEEFSLLAVIIADKSALVLNDEDKEMYDPKFDKKLTQRIREYADKYKVKFGVRTLIFTVKKRKIGKRK